MRCSSGFSLSWLINNAWESASIAVIINGSPFNDVPQDLYIPPDVTEVLLATFEVAFGFIIVFNPSATFRYSQHPDRTNYASMYGLYSLDGCFKHRACSRLFSDGGTVS
jgi:hypothetical protein